MVFEAQLQNILALFQANPIIAVAGGGIVVVLFYFKTKEMFKLVGFCLFIAVVFYVLTLLAGTVSTGSKHKDQMIYKSKEVLGE
jgi:4-hydroxybenzoate polyprenyltransferase